MKINGTLALAHLYQGQHELAWQAAETTVQLRRWASAPVFWGFEGYAGPAEVFLALWETSLTDDRLSVEPRTPGKSARQATQAMHAFTRVFPFGRPRAWLYQGLYDWLAGNTRQAQRAWHRSLAAATQPAMPYEQGLAHYEIGRHLSAGDLARSEHLNRAAHIFAQLNTALDLARTRQALQQAEGG